MWDSNDRDVMLIFSELTDLVATRCVGIWPEPEDLVDLCGYIGQAKRLAGCGQLDPIQAEALGAAELRRATLCFESYDAIDSIDIKALVETLTSAVSGDVHPRELFDSLMDLDFARMAGEVAGRSDFVESLDREVGFVTAAFLGIEGNTQMCERFMKRHGVAPTGIWEFMAQIEIERGATNDSHEY